jgi:hypothetical protein
MPGAKVSVRTVPSWGERNATGGATGRATPVRSVRHTGQTDAGLDRQLLIDPPMSAGTFAAFSKFSLNTSNSPNTKVVCFVKGHIFHVE